MADNGTVLVVPSERSESVINGFVAKGWVLLVVDGSALGSKDDLLESISTVMRFPSYFGRNWDALLDCLRDLDDWIPAKQYVVLLSKADHFAKACPSDFRTFVEIFRTASEFHAQQHISLLLVIEAVDADNIRDSIT